MLGVRVFDVRCAILPLDDCPSRPDHLSRIAVIIRRFLSWFLIWASRPSTPQWPGRRHAWLSAPQLAHTGKPLAAATMMLMMAILMIMMMMLL